MSARGRAAAVMIGVALLPVLSCSGKSGSQGTRPPTPIRWIAAGDSFSSGEGAPGSSGLCGRTDQAMAPRAQALLAGEVDVAAFVHVACTRAVIDQVLDQVRGAAATSRGVPFNLVTLTIGGNNVGFATVLVQCVGPFGCGAHEDELIGRAGALTAELVPVYKEILGELARGGALVVVGYPNLFADPAGWSDERCAGVSKSDAAMIRRVAAEIDLRIADAAKQANVTYVPMIDAFKGHELCGSQETWINGLTSGLTNGTLRPTSAFHPTGAGQQAEAEVLAKALRKLYGLG